MNIEREFPLHVAIWNNDTEKLAEVLRENKVSCSLYGEISDVDIVCLFRIELNNLILVIELRCN